MYISILNDFAVFDAGKQKNIDQIIQKLEKLNSNIITINFSNCLIDYPATSKLIDKVLADLSQLDGQKEMIIQSDLTVNNESLILSLLVWGSSYFDFSTIQRISPSEAYRALMIPKLRNQQIKIKIELLKDDDSLFNQFLYE